MSTFAVPVTNISCSRALCQCHGITQPEAAFAMIVAAPLEGSPLATEIVAHLGRTGRLPNLALAMEAVAIVSSAIAGDRAIPTARNSSSVQATTRIVRPPEL